jgi:signal transduction histidine kinase
MLQQKSSEVIMRRNGGLAFIITIIIAYAQWLSSGLHPLFSTRAIVILFLGLVYIGASIWVINSDLPKSKIIILGFIGIQVLLGLVIVYLSEGTTWLLIFPIVSQVVIALPGLESWLLNGAIYIVLLSGLSILEGGFNWQVAFGLTCGMVFVILFSQMVLSEQKNRSEVERLYAELSAATHKLRAYMVKAEELAILQERNRLARDIHDGLGHYLTALNMQIKAAQALLSQDQSQVMETLAKAQSLAESALSDIRNSVAVLRGEPSLSQPLPDALESLLLECRAEGLVTEIITKGDYRLLTPQSDLTLYRVAQEALTNVRKHALASRVDVTLFYASDKVNLTICDNGIGSNNPEGGYGLLGLRERVQILHGTVTIRTELRHGFCVEVELPG